MPGMDHILTKAFLATGGAVAYPQWSVVQQVAAVGVVPAAVQLAPTALGTAGAADLGTLGVCQEPLDAVKTATGKAFIGVALLGNTKVIWDGVGTPALGAYVVPSGTTAGRVKVVANLATFQGFQVLGQLIALPGSPLPTFGASAAAGDLFDITLTPGARI
jgi:hypothetical protein